MKCPKCGYTNSPYIRICQRCNADLLIERLKGHVFKQYITTSLFFIFIIWGIVFYLDISSIKKVPEVDAKIVSILILVFFLGITFYKVSIKYITGKITQNYYYLHKSKNNLDVLFLTYRLIFWLFPMIVVFALYNNLFNNIILYLLSGILINLLLTCRWIHNYEKIYGSIQFAEKREKED